VALPINFGQTISSPWTVARMTELLRANLSLGKVLEIGTGCGYQTAVLAQLAQEVYSIERIGPLLTRTRIRLRELRISNAYLKHADGLLGLPEAGPFDGIIMTAVTTQVPESLLEQLMIRGRIVYPKGSRRQNLCVIEHTPQGFIETILDEVKFVPILSGVISK
jgi:protein-L-isoaspartate(D-aspartate) O-methyltransferase